MRINPLSFKHLEGLEKTLLEWIRSAWRELVSVCMSLVCIANDIVRIETSYASGDQRHLVQEYQYVVKDAKERYLVFDIVNCEINVVKYAYMATLFSVSFSWQNMVEKLIMKENDIDKEWALIIR